MAESAFDPLAILGALERHRVDCVLIGGLAQVLRGADVITRGVDICPSFGRGNVDRLNDALEELVTGRSEGSLVVLKEEALVADPIVRVVTRMGSVGIAASPAGVPNGYVDLRRAASREHLGGPRPLVASTGDLAAMAAALHRPEDLERLPMLRRIVELEVKPDKPAPLLAASSPRATPTPSRRSRRVTR